VIAPQWRAIDSHRQTRGDNARQSLSDVNGDASRNAPEMGSIHEATRALSIVRNDVASGRAQIEMAPRMGVPPPPLGAARNSSAFSVVRSSFVSAAR
jgi:hypothetical protein